MLGLFAHKVVEVLHGQLRPQHRAVPTVSEISAVVDRLLPHLASELLLPGQLHRLAGVRATIETTVMMFFLQLRAAGSCRRMRRRHSVRSTFTVEALSSQLRSRAAPMRHRADGRTAVIDLKWSNTEKYLREDVQRGEALQLAVYQWALNDGDSPPDFGSVFPAQTGYLRVLTPGICGPALPTTPRS
jgi:hypothetical protein